jgi:hypothetical protein
MVLNITPIIEIKWYPKLLIRQNVVHPMELVVGPEPIRVMTKVILYHLPALPFLMIVGLGFDVSHIICGV